ncbi:hypothetical protein CRUP_002995 [Coryphaenoides rupestris]|nr:hypothetical protein CRUP_002995 [Coryphaenoides rupestris]
MEQHLLGGSMAGRWVSTCCSYRTLKAWLPILSWLPQYNLSWLQMDVIAGLTVGLTTVPQALAYAEVAGLPVQYGLYSAFMGGFIYTFLGTSKDVTLGPTAIMSLLCASVVTGDPARAVLLSLLCGIAQTALALLRLGIPQKFYLEVYYTFSRLPEARPGDALLGLLWPGAAPYAPADEEEPGFPSSRRRLPLVGFHIFTITGKTAQGLPPFRPPPTSEITANGTVVSFGEMVERIACHLSSASQNNYRVDPNQELLAIGLTNIMGSFVSAYPVTGSFGRTAVNSQTGVCTPAGGLGQQ